MNRLFAGLPQTIFDVMSGLARETGAVNLGQGFPEWDGPLDVREAAARAVIEGPNQYPPMRGLPILREAVAEHYGRLQGVALDWRTEVTVTSGATEALAAALLAVIEPGDEVILFEPMYDSYLPMLKRAGATARFVRLQPPHWRMPDLEGAVTERTRAVVLNTPNNPASAILHSDDLERLAALCVKHGLVAISDEVWEHVSFDGLKHRPLMSFPGMRERTIKIGSAGKMFSMTGWKVGFMCAAPELTEAAARAHQFLTFTTPPNLQAAAAYGLGKPASFFDDMRADLQRRRDRLAAALAAEGFRTLASTGAYFMAVDLRASGIAMADAAFALRAVREAGVATIPVSAFYAADPETSLVRLCFAKHDATLDAGVERLAKARRLLS